ncbi:acetamidase/formamidase/AraC-like DNA-binding protein [Bradyrhizobium sp. USDA 4524]|uniref:acetamidase/formamidase family protein n=1 Tax=Bradyrhizobium TaxID=374 RepID=UPI00209CE1A7|nr:MULTISPECIES: acetamidase/formamidase family protein [Bradyrhizobium]MCP1840868.1 acetamidase/formamidase/AraC-like DNA-binding protein [Bradyrhizobium sp. USDA 4538]MCP1901431.1 acetamidase/formamidase/AraC-like DNA-binding protein [Bradyrhizobium sp. USDA 4537]MCP1992913.1 acetamidase/formamidase/AraC-like DNA-binding protein [Bradyrhizobium sp. USDA 4539]MCP3419415.1 acetamidase/formamidase family protein [Bradyrhizobium brasilense]
MVATTYRVSVDAIPRQNRREVWREALAGLQLDCELPEAGQFQFGELTAKRSTSGGQLALLRSTEQQIVCSGHAASPGMPARVAIIFHGYGRGSITSGQRSCEFADNDVSVCDLQSPWRMTLREDFEILLLELPRERLLGRLGHNRLRLPAVLGATIAAASVRPVMRTLGGNFAILDKADLVTAEVAVTELVAGALLGETRLDAEAMTQVQAGHLRRVDAAIEAQLGNAGLTIADIARQEGLSQRYLQRLFERQNTTFSAYVRERRLERCCNDLIDPNYADQRIAEISYRWGFTDQAHFSRMFSATYGTSPRDFRKAVPRDVEGERTRGRPRLARGTATVLRLAPNLASSPVARETVAPLEPIVPVEPAGAVPEGRGASHHHLKVSRETAHWGYLSRAIPPVMSVQSGAVVTIETLTQHAFDDYERMIKGDPGAESVFRWTAEGKSVERRGAGPMDGSIFGRGAGEGFGVHICTGPIYVCGAEPGDVLEVQILDIWPRPSANPAYAGKSFGSNAAAWWGFQYNDLIDPPAKRETITIFETDAQAEWAHAVYSYRWTPQTDPFGVRHETMDYPGVPVDHATVEKQPGVLAGVRIPARLHFGFMAVAPRESDIIDSIPPGYFGGNVDNWRATKGTTLYLPVAVSGALFSIGDPHFAQGDGEVNGTALELSLTGQFRFILHKSGRATKPHVEGLAHPLLETPEEWILHGFSYGNYLRELGRNAQSEIYQRSSVDLALRNAFRATRKFLMECYCLSEDEALALISLGVDFGVTQVADGNWGVHAIVRKSMLPGASGA